MTSLKRITPNARLSTAKIVGPLWSVLEQPIMIGLDTEFWDAHTLTIQVTTRLSERTLAVQLYRSPTVCNLQRDFDISKYLPSDRLHYGRFFD
jgi:hypothetical protein